MGEEKLDNTVYTIRGLRDLADMAAARATGAAPWARAAAAMERGFEEAWWYGGDARAYADSLEDPRTKGLQRHWIGVTPTGRDARRPAGRAAAAGVRARTVAALTSASGLATPAGSGSSTPAPDGRATRRQPGRDL